MTVANEVSTRTRRIVGLQSGTAVVIAAGFFLAKGGWEACSVLYGGGASMAVTLLLSRGIIRAGDSARENRNRSMRILYLGALQRFLLVLALLGAGLALIRLDPLATVVGFVATQLAFMVSMGRFGS